MEKEKVKFELMVKIEDMLSFDLKYPIYLPIKVLLLIVLFFPLILLDVALTIIFYIIEVIDNSINISGWLMLITFPVYLTLLLVSIPLSICFSILQFPIAIFDNPRKSVNIEETKAEDDNNTFEKKKILMMMNRYLLKLMKWKRM